MIDFALQKMLHTAEGEMRLQVQAAIESSQFICLYGSSGAGKTSVLRMLAGFMKPDDGNIKLNDALWFDAKQKINITPQQRKIGFVFQNFPKTFLIIPSQPKNNFVHFFFCASFFLCFFNIMRINSRKRHFVNTFEILHNAELKSFKKLKLLNYFNL